MSRPDFAQKLLSDLKMRKERMVATHGSGRASSNMSADAYRGSKRSLKGSTDMKSLAKGNSNAAKMQNSRMKADTSNQIVPYGGVHSTKQPLDMSMTLSYALDDNGKLKKMNFTGSNAMIGFLQQISRRTMDIAEADGSARSRIQWPSSAQFPTLTHLHIDEVSKGAQRLNQILKTFYNGVNSNGCSVDIGKELLKGAVELEESLRMLVSLQEASEHMVVPKRKSRVKLLEMGEENEDGKDDEAVKKRVDRPVFSFDRRAKDEKKVMAITYPKEASDQGKAQKTVSSHRRSASCGAELRSSPVASSQTNSRAKAAGISNVVAKLMGLEEIPRNGGDSNKVGRQVARSNNALDRIVSERMSFGVSRGEFGDEDGWSIGPHSEIEEGARSSKIVILTSKESDERKPAWSQREREQIMTHIMQLNRKSAGEEFREQALGRKENGGVKKALLKDEAQKAANLVQGKRVSKENGNERRGVNKVPERRVGQDKSVRDGRLQHPKSPQRVETQGKYQKLEAKNSKKVVSRGPSKKVEAVIEDPSPKDIYEVKSSQAKEEKGRREMVLQEVSSERQKEMANLKPRQDLSLHQEEAKSQANDSNVLNIEANKPSAVAIQKAAHSNKMVKSGPNQKANEVMAKPAKSSRPSRAMKQQATILQGLKQRQPVSKRFQQPNAGTKPTSDNSKQHMEVQRAIDTEISYTCDELPSCEDRDNVPRILSDQDVNLTMPCDQLDQPLMQVKDTEAKPQTIELVQAKEALSKPEIQQPLTDDEIYLKQILITSQVFLNTAEALFKLNIPIGVLNASDILCQDEKGAKQVTDCAYEMLKMKGKRRELVFYPCKNAVISDIKLRSLDDLVRQLHKDFESLRSYGNTGKSEFDQAEYLLKMLERDMHHKEMDLNCMWDMGWSKTVFGYLEMDEVIRDVEKCVINELLDDVLEGFMESSPKSTHGGYGENMRNGVIGVTAC